MNLLKLKFEMYLIFILLVIGVIKVLEKVFGIGFGIVNIYANYVFIGVIIAFILNTLFEVLRKLK